MMSLTKRFQRRAEAQDELSTQVPLIETYTPNQAHLPTVQHVHVLIRQDIDADREALMTSVRIGVPGQNLCVTCYPSAGFELRKINSIND